ncbi:MAG TPA: PAS domain S-box protein, partial [Pyrinomonadaceae bacterium]|nr:PAS domain S-box protein [Pyrinomonadaceae bacterium]
MPFEPHSTPAHGEEAAAEWVTRLQSPDVAPYWLSAIIESADDAIVSKTLEGVITSWNKGAERVFGYTAGEVIGKPVTILFPPDHENEEPAILERIRRGERVEHYETVRVRKDGTRIDISLTVSPVRGPDGRIIGASKIARDITEQRRARRAIDEGRERLNLALSAAHLGDWSWDAATDGVRMSEEAAAIFGVPPGQALTWAQMREMLHEDDREQARLAVERSTVEGTDYDIEYRIVRPNGERRWVSAKGRALYHEEGGRPLGMLGVVQDITERKRTEEALREQTEALRPINEVVQIVSADLDLH